MPVLDSYLNMFRSAAIDRPAPRRGRFLLGACLAAFAALTGAPASAQDASAGVAFVDTVVANVNHISSIQMSPDGQYLYAATLAGVFHRWPVDAATGDLGEMQTLELPYFQDATGPRGMVGLAFDPSDPSILWVTDNFPVARSGSQDRRPDFSGRVSRIKLGDGPEFTGEAETYAFGFPRSCGDHMTNSLRFHEDPTLPEGARQRLYLTQGSNSAMGEADPSWCYRPDRLLSATVLEIDPTLTPPPGGFDVTTEPVPEEGSRRFGYSWVLKSLIWPSDDGVLKNGGIEIDSGPYDGQYLHFAADGVASVREGEEADSPLVKTFYDPFAPDAPVKIYATGLRNAYDLVWHSNGALYVPVNGATGGGSVPDDPSTEQDERVTKVGRSEDFLFKVERGAYLGHPSPLRDEFIANGGNPTEGVDPVEVAEYPVGIMPDPRYRLDLVYPLGHHWSPNGVIEYTSDALGAAFQNAIVFVNFSKGNNLRALTLDADGKVAGDFTLKNPDGQEIAYPDPLDVTEGAEGRIYMSTLARSNGQSQIVKLEPAVSSAQAAPHE